MGREATLGLGLRQLSSQYSQGEANVQLLHPSSPIPSHAIPQPHRDQTSLSAAQTCSLPSKSAERQKEALGGQCRSWIQPGLHHSAWSVSLVPSLLHLLQAGGGEARSGGERPKQTTLGAIKHVRAWRMWMDGDTEAHAVRGRALRLPARGAAAAPGMRPELLQGAEPEWGSPRQQESMRRQGEYCRISSTKLWALQQRR